ncbi:MAG: transposase [Beijerinckiaceae bacterium]
MTIYAGAVTRNQVHMLISIPPQLSVPRAVQFLKGKSLHKLLSEYQALRKRYWGQHPWGATGRRQAATLPMISGTIRWGPETRGAG